MSNSPRNDKPKSIFELLAERLTEAAEEMDLEKLSDGGGDGFEKLSAEDLVMPTFTEEDLEKLEEEAYQGWMPLAAQLSGAFNALCAMNFDEDQAMEIVLAKFEHSLWEGN